MLSVCPKCGSTYLGTRVEPMVGAIRFCRDCEHVMPQDEDPRPQPQAVATPGPAAVHTAETKRPKREPQPDAPANPVPAMKARLRWLDSEIRRLRKLEAERETLAHILSAASGKPVAVVRELPKRSHG